MGTLAFCVAYHRMNKRAWIHRLDHTNCCFIWSTFLKFSWFCLDLQLCLGLRKRQNNRISNFLWKQFCSIGGCIAMHYRFLMLYYWLKMLTCMLLVYLNNAKINYSFKTSCFWYCSLLTNCNITLSKETLALLNPLDDFEHDDLQNASKYFKHNHLLNSWRLHKHWW